ncbi:hypothetical protein [Microbacterium sp.]|jgi:hypothetical protein|uniref:hypothetical protein n=1 Tax=Microbacterium sp. TaxID=51671 RepID=UPI0037C86C45
MARRSPWARRVTAEDAPTSVTLVETGESVELVAIPGKPGEVMLRTELEQALADRDAADAYDRHTTAIEEFEQLDRARALWRPPCHDDLRFVTDSLPIADRIELQDICLTRCRIRGQCDAYARRARPSSGTWAGRSYLP